MKVKSITIINFKSIGENCTLPLDNKSTVLVGPSNVGKSNILKAIEFAFGDLKLASNETCSWLSTSSADVVTILFSIEDSDSSNLKNISENLIDKKHLEYIKNLDGSAVCSFLPDDDIDKLRPPADLPDFLKNIRRRLSTLYSSMRNTIPADRRSESLSQEFLFLNKMIKDKIYFKVLPSKAEQTDRLKEILDKVIVIRDQINKIKTVEIKQLTGIKRRLTLIKNDLNSYIPTIKYEKLEVKTYSRSEIANLLPIIVLIEGDELLSIEQSIAFDEIKDAPSTHFMKLLIDLSDVNINILTGSDNAKMAQQIERANDKLTGLLNKYWNQEEIKIKLKDTWDQGKNKLVMLLHVEDKEGHRSDISDQSPGFQWFLAFTIKYLLSNEAQQNKLFILDEPGLHLSPDAQNDLLARFEQISNRVQILFTTHSPYMINKNYPQRVRLVEKGKKQSDNGIKGTYINPKPYHSKSRRAWEPIRSGIGLSAGASLFVAGNNLIVEGISDQILLSAVIQSISKYRDPAPYDLNKVCICFSGPGNIVPMALFCLQETDSTVVLLDTDVGEARKKRLIKSGFQTERNIFILGEIPNISSKTRKIIDIEDLFDHDFYHDRFLGAYSKIPGYKAFNELPKTWADVKKYVNDSSSTEDEITKKNQLIGHSKYYEKYFTSKKEDLGSFNKVIVATEIAEYLLDCNEDELNRLTDSAIKVIDAIWKSQQKWK